MKQLGLLTVLEAHTVFPAFGSRGEYMALTQASRSGIAYHLVPIQSNRMIPSLVNVDAESAVCLPFNRVMVCGIEAMKRWKIGPVTVLRP
jgi:hypothetical protein